MLPTMTANHTTRVVSDNSVSHTASGQTIPRDAEHETRPTSTVRALSKSTLTGGVQ